jgi:hypothetical protein
MHHKDSDFLRRQAELCIALSRSTFDLTAASRLRVMAEELLKKASEWEGGLDCLAPGFVGRTGSEALGRS